MFRSIPQTSVRTGRPTRKAYRRLGIERCEERRLLAGDVVLEWNAVAAAPAAGIGSFGCPQSGQIALTVARAAADHARPDAVHIAAGDVNGDGRADFVTRVADGTSNTLMFGERRAAAAPEGPSGLVIMPDPGIRSLEFTSHTRPHNDGLVLASVTDLVLDPFNAEGCVDDMIGWNSCQSLDERGDGGPGAEQRASKNEVAIETLEIAHEGLRTSLLASGECFARFANTQFDDAADALPFDRSYLPPGVRQLTHDPEFETWASVLAAGTLGRSLAGAAGPIPWAADRATQVVVHGLAGNDELLV